MENSMVKVFDSGEFGKLRTVNIKGDVWFYGIDVCKALGYANSRKAIADHIDGDDKTTASVRYSKTDPTPTLISGKGVQELINRSRKCASDYKERLLICLSDNELITNVNIVTSRKEIEFVDSLEKTLEPFDLTIEKQYRVLSYRIDFYIKEVNLAIEYDENNHSGYSYESQEGRQKEIEHAIGCTFLRLSDHDSDMYNIGLVMKQILTMSLKHRKVGAIFYAQPEVCQ